ncbi:MAG TPA: hypothetical protein VHR72_07330, partial [Gemmataceae bacterium]|nr:hypothetical protein [Gemmataceae bacterium]
EFDGAAREEAEDDLLVQKAQLAAMMEEVKHLQDELRRQAQEGHAQGGEVEVLHQQVAELTQQLDAARAHRIDESQLRQIMSDVEVLQQQNAQLREQAAIAERVKAVEAENRDLLERLTSPSQGNDNTGAELERLRIENRNLLQLADEVQKQFGMSGSSLGNDEAIAALKRENESLRAHLVAAETSTLDGTASDLSREIEDLRHLLHDAESKLEKFEQTKAMPPESGEGNGAGLNLPENGAAAADLELLHNEIRLLKELLGEKDSAIREMEEASERSTFGDSESYEAELNRFRKELEADRNKLNDEITSLRVRNSELDEATREMEMEMSRERAEMARERIRLDRLRDEIKVDMERMQREHEVRGTLASVHKLRDDLKNSTAGGSAHGGKGAPVNDRLRTIRGN